MCDRCRHDLAAPGRDLCAFCQLEQDLNRAEVAAEVQARQERELEHAEAVDAL